jgi:Zn-finger nucleic acid-binding protein
MPRSNAIDDAGNPVTVLNEAAFVGWPVATDWRLRVLCERLELMVRRRMKFINYVFGIPAFAITMVGVMLARGFVPQIPFIVLLLGVSLLEIPFIRFVYRLALRPAQRAIADTILAEGLCPSCGYNFVGLDLSAALFHCPECGAAWNASRIQRLAPFEGEAQGIGLRELFRQMQQGDRNIVKDDRGRRTKLVHPRLRDHIRTTDPAYNARAIQARKRMALSGAWIRWPVGTGFIALGVFVGYLVLGVGGSLRASGSLLFAFAFTIGFGIWILRSNFCYSPRAIVEAMKHVGLCPSCGADLASVSPDAEGVRMCPLCYGAWSSVAATPRAH